MGLSELTEETPLAARLPSSPKEARSEKRYAVKAIWRTLQGEGAWAGRPAVFVRFAGCNMWTGHEADRQRDADRNHAACPLWCDTDFRKEGAAKLAFDALVDEARQVAVGDYAEPIRFVVLTGGEPLLQADAALIRALHAAGFFVACETNGTLALADAFTDLETGDLVAPDWVVCSPKLPAERVVLETMDELKLVVPDYQPEAYADLVARVRTHTLSGTPTQYLWLQPEDGSRLDEATRVAVRLAMEQPSWRVSVQTHKILGVD